jgi:ATP-dependent DNA ligase
VGPPCKHDDEVQFYAFDILVSEGEDLRNLPLSMRKANLTVIPSFAAHYRNHPQMMPIFLINFF